MILHQLQGAYRIEEDRLLLRVSFKADDDSLQEIRAWMTRRLVKILWTDIIQALEMQVMLDHPSAAHACAEIVGIEYQATVSRFRAHGNFNAPFAPQVDSFPFGEQPILLTQAPISVQANHTPRINFVSAHNGSFEIALTLSMMHGLCTLLQDTVKQADWDVELRLPGMPVEQRIDEKRVLN